MKTIERDPTVQPQTAAAVSAEVRSRTPLNDRIATRRLEAQSARSGANTEPFPSLTRGMRQPVRTTEVWSLSTRSAEITGAIAYVVVAVVTAPIALVLHPGLLCLWLFVGPLVVAAGVGNLIDPYEVQIVPSGRL